MPERKVQIALPETGDAEWQALREVLASGWLTQGPQVAAFEREFAVRHQVGQAVAVTSCTTALQLALAGLGIGPGDEVIVPSFTWVATANVVIHQGAVPVLADIRPGTWDLDPAEVARRLTPRTRAVIAVHLFGLCTDLGALAAAAPGIPIIEDAACAVGAAWQGRPAGGLGRIAAFSFHPRKTITTGEGGMVTTDDADLAERVRVLRNHGASLSEEERHRGPAPWRLPTFAVAGFNYRMADLQAAVGRVQLGKLDRLLAERRAGVAFYRQALADLPWLELPPPQYDAEHGFQAFVCRVDPPRAPRPRDELMAALAQAGVATRPGTHAVHALDYYRKRFGYRPEDRPVAWAAENQTLAIPLHNRMVQADFEHVAASLHALGRQ